MLLAGDVGGTKTDLAVYSPEAGPYSPLTQAEMRGLSQSPGFGIGVSFGSENSDRAGQFRCAHQRCVGWFRRIWVGEL